MADVGVATAGVAAAGLTIFGVSTGLEPAVLIAGFAGGVWAQSYSPPAPYLHRLGMTLLAALLAGYLGPAIAVGITAWEPVRGVFPGTILQLPVAVLVGLLAHRVLGPAIMRIVRRRADRIAEDGKK